MKAELSAAQRYVRSIHWPQATVCYVEYGEEQSVPTMRFFYTRDWTDADFIAAVQRRQPTWRNIELGLNPPSLPLVTPSYRRKT